MKRVFLSLFTIMLFAFLAGCSSSSTKDITDPSDIDISDLEGTWDLIEASLTNQNNPSQVIDFLNYMGTMLEITTTINSDGSYTTVTKTTTAGITTEETETGVFTSNEDGIDDGDNNPNTTVTLSGNTLTLENTDFLFDFNGDLVFDEPATFRNVLQRR